MSGRRPRGTVPVEVLGCIVAGCDERGIPPHAPEIADQLSLSASAVRRALRQLLDEGSIAQPYGEGGPYVPLKRPDGTPVRLALVDEAPRHDPLIALVERLPEEKRGAAEAYLRFLVEG